MKFFAALLAVAFAQQDKCSPCLNKCMQQHPGPFDQYCMDMCHVECGFYSHAERLNVGIIELDSLAQQTQMDEMALNNQLSHMVTSIQQQQDKLQKKIYADMAKETDLEGKIRDLQSQLKALRDDLKNEKQTFKDFSTTADEINADRRKVQAQQEKMLNDLKARSDKLQRSALSSINLNNLMYIQ